MPNLVDTTLGPVPRDKLIATDHVFEESECRTLATEWRLDGELVRRDVFVSKLQGLSAGVTHGS